jgi:hypothetical protein
LPDLGFRLVARVEHPDFAGLTITSHGQIYAIFNQVLDGSLHSAPYRLEGDAWVLVADDAPSEIVGFSDSGSVWAAAPDMTAVWNGEAWVEYGPDAGWTFAVGTQWQLVSGFLSASDGTIWIATGQDVRAFDGERWRVYTYSDMTMEPVHTDDGIRSRFSLAEVNGVIWVGECTHSPLGPVDGVGARWFDGGAWHGADSPAATGCVTEIAKGPDGVVWLDVGPTLYGHDPVANTWTAYHLPAPPDGSNRFGYITNMPFDADGNPWPELTTCGGAHCYYTFPRYRLDRASGSFQRVVSNVEFTGSRLIFDTRGQGWRFDLDGIYRLKGNHFEFVSDAQVQSSARTPDGAIWIICRTKEGGGLWVLPGEI